MGKKVGTLEKSMLIIKYRTIHFIFCRYWTLNFDIILDAKNSFRAFLREEGFFFPEEDYTREEKAK